ncbi:hypothetical protein IEQ34_018628 [Dendrobium chrysotoxum]|uniref:Remorin C-terminal domain-containing protein n=1 Tax=Dendrobium chrysotoxum TaxID=161865 RepID=A0AAV7G5Q8_DENCH|nr:hypothetical protein IEQ34_018628 [Dendrobium chrysotoxum]
MGEEEAKNVFGGFTMEAASPEPAQADSTMDVSEEKSVIPPSPDEKPDEAKALVVVESMNSTNYYFSVHLSCFDVPPSFSSKWAKGSVVAGFVCSQLPHQLREALVVQQIDANAILARVETEKRLSIIKAWEDSEKVKAENKAVKKMHSITAWENTKKATVEAELKKIEVSFLS